MQPKGKVFSAMDSFKDASRLIHDDLVKLRRDLHRFPELGNDLPRTQQRVLKELEGLPLEISLGSSLTSITAVLRGGKPGKTVLLRGDMDGLPVQEDNDLDYKSENNNMHACGHDLHTAGLVGAARLLCDRKDELEGNVVFMFQPGEEGPGGAKPMIDEGVLDASGERASAAFGIHVMPGEQGVFFLRGGTAMAGSNCLSVTMHGMGGHGSQPHNTLDPVAPLVEFCQALQTMVTRRFSVFDPIVVSTTVLRAGEAYNVIPPNATMKATVRTLSKDSWTLFNSAVRELACSIAAGHGCTAEVNFETTYPVSVNDHAEADNAAETLSSLFGKDRVVIADDPLMGSEDFSYVLDQVPGAFIFLQATPPEIDPETAEVNHSPKVLFDDAVLADQSAALAALAWRTLNGSGA